MKGLSLKPRMIHYSILITIILIVFFKMGFTKEIITYQNYFKGLQLGKSTLTDVISKLGRPLTENNKGNINLIYQGFIVTIHKHNRKINTVIILTHNFIDKNGFRVGDDVTRLKAKGLVIKKSSYAVDFENGITYWLKNEKIKKIALAHEFVKR